MSSQPLDWDLAAEAPDLRVTVDPTPAQPNLADHRLLARNDRGGHEKS